MAALRQYLNLLAACGLALITAVVPGGCAVDRSDKIPNSAVVATEGQQHISYTAGYRGTAYVYDVSSNELLWSGPVSRGDTVGVDSGHNAITVNTRTVSDRHLNGDDKYRIFFDRGDTYEREPK